MVRLIELHAHVLPAVDDGPATVGDAVALCRAMADAGIARVVATSHVSEEYPNTPETLSRAREALVGALADAGVALEVLSGAEITLEAARRADDETLRALALGNSRYVLLEAPLSPSVVDAAPAIRAVLGRGHGVVLAHPERAPCFQRDHRQLVELVADGALTSITAGALHRRFGRTAEAAAWRMLEEDLVHDIASDAHNGSTRPPGLAVPIPAPAAAWLTTDAPAAILRGERPAPPPVRIDRPSAAHSPGPVARLRRRLGR